jgi:hypothetical protein
MGGFCRQNSLENPLPRHDANPCDWNPSLFEMRDPKYPSVMANKNRSNMILYFILGWTYALYAHIILKQFCKEVCEAEARFVVANASGQLVNALPPLRMTATVKQHALQRFNDAGIFL